MKVGNSKSSGFTIVELLIVVIVIAILATIAVVAYNGVQNRAADAAVATEVSQASRKIESYKISQGSERYPDTLEQIGVTAASGMTLTYQVDNNINPAGYCLSATRGTVSYRVTNGDTTPSAGNCTITNLAVNPSCEASTTYWTIATGSGSSTMSQGSNGLMGNYSCRQLFSSTATGTTGPNISQGSLVQELKPYTISGHVRVNKTQSLVLTLRWLNEANDTVLQETVLPDVCYSTPNVWQRLSVTKTAPAGAAKLRYFFYTNTSGRSCSAAWQAGDAYEIDGVMITQGTTLLPYRDGNSPGWSWSSNTTPPLSTGPLF